METVKDNIERLKGKAEIFLKNNTPVFIVDTSDNYYFCYVLFIDEDYLYIKNFAGKREGEEEKIIWFDIIKFELYKEENEKINHTSKMGEKADGNS